MFTRNLKTIQWIVTGLAMFMMLGSGIGDLLMVDQVMDSIRTLGYPDYIATILGVAKVLGVAAVLIPGLPRLKEWAYAGFTFDLGGAFVSHVLNGDPLQATITPVVPLLIVLASYFLYQRVKAAK